MKYTERSSETRENRENSDFRENSDLPRRNMETLVDPELIVTCKHCGKQIDRTILIGISLMCPSCGKSQN